MAQTTIPMYKPLGTIHVKPEDQRVAENITADANVIILKMGVQLKGFDGQPTRLRGIRAIVKTTGMTPPITPIPNESEVQTVWLEGQALQINENTSVTFLDEGLIDYGIMETI